MSDGRTQCAWICASIHAGPSGSAWDTITVPSHAAKPVLEFLAYRIGVVSASEIADHKRYFNKCDLLDIAERAGFALVQHRYFELGFNNFALLRPSGRSCAEAIADA